MNTTLKVLAAAIPMTFLTGCYGPTLTDKEIQLELVQENGISIVSIFCKANKPIMIKSISVNGRDPYYPVTTESMHPMAMAIQPGLALKRFLPMEVIQKDEMAPVVLPCVKGQREIILGAMAFSPKPEEREVIDVTIVTTNYGTNTWTFE